MCIHQFVIVTKVEKKGKKTKPVEFHCLQCHATVDKPYGDVI